jgi:hypothetical protein
MLMSRFKVSHLFMKKYSHKKINKNNQLGADTKNRSLFYWVFSSPIYVLVSLALVFSFAVPKTFAADIAPTVQNVGTQVSGTTDITTSLPTYADGDLLLLFVFWDRGDYAIPDLSAGGWTQVQHTESSNAQFQTGLTVYSKVATSSVAAPIVTLNLAASTIVRTVIVSFNDATGVDVKDGAASTGTGITSFDAPSITTTDTNTLVLNAIVSRNTENVTAPNTEIYNDGAFGANNQTSISTFTQASAGSTGAQTFTGANMYRPSTVSIALLGSDSPVGSVINLSGTLYSDEGVTPITSGKTIKVAVGTSTVSTHSTTTDSGAGTWTITATDSSNIATSTPFVVYMDGDSTSAVTVTKASSTNDITGIDLYQNRVVLKHEATSGTSTTISDLSIYDNDDDTDIPYWANSGTLVVATGTELHIASSTVFAPGGPVTLQSGSATAEDGTLHLPYNSTYTAGGLTSIGGSFNASSTSTFTPHASGLLFTSTSTGRTVSGFTDMGDLTFNGSGGGWTFADNATTSDFTITAGSVTAPSQLAVAGDYTNEGTFNANSGTVTFNGADVQTATGTMTGSSAFSALTINNTSANGTTSRSIIFGTVASTTGTFTMLASTSAQFPENATSTFQNINFSGALDSPVWLRSNATSTKWGMYVPGTQIAVSYVDVRDNNASSSEGFIIASNSTDSGNNSGWNFLDPLAAKVWNATDWNTYVKLTIDANKVDDDLTDFPVYVDLSDLGDDFWNGINNGGGDIRITTDDGSPVELPREVVFADTGTDTGELHFKANSISSTTNTIFRIYYNGTTTDDYEDDATYGAENVWSNDYAAVYHLDDDPSGGAGAILDSTANARHGTSNGSMLTGDEVSAQMGNGLDFDGTQNVVISGLMGSSSNVTLSVWVDTDSLDSSGVELVSLGDNIAITNYVSVSGLGGFYRHSTDWNTTDSGVPTAGQGWKYVTYTLDDAGDEQILYVDGEVEVTTGYTEALVYDQGSDTYLAVHGNGATNRDLNGRLDEVRIASTTRTSAWVSAEYANQYEPQGFYSTSTVVKEFNDTDWVYYDTITIQSTNISSTLTDFPVYVDLSDLSDRFWTMTNEGTDIRVTNISKTELPRELVSASTSARTGELHFKADTISSSTDTEFRIYYNGTTTRDYLRNETYGSENVWTNNYVGVWHFNEDPAVAGSRGILDSTSYENHGTDSGGMSASNIFSSGVVGQAYTFDRVDGTYIDVGDPSDGSLDFGAGQEFTLSSWLKSGDTTNSQYVFDKRLSTGYQLRYTTVGGFFLRIDEGASNRDVATSQTVMNDSWHYVVAGRSTTQAFIYVDDNAPDTVADASLANLSETQPLTFGGPGEFWDGELDEMRISSTVRSAAWIAAEYLNQSNTSGFYATSSIQAGTLTLANHTVGQADNAFAFQNRDDYEAFAFKLTPATENATVTTLTLNVFGISEDLDTSSISDIKLYEDTDNDGVFDGGDIIIDATGVFVFSGQSGTITFDGDFLVDIATDYLVTFDTSNIDTGESLTIDLLPSNISAVGDTTWIPITPTGAVDSIQHIRGSSRGAGGSIASIGGAAPQGREVVEGGGAGGGSVVGEETDGDNIADDPNYFPPTSNGATFNEWTNPNNVHDSDGVAANAASSILRQSYDGFGFSIPGNNQINGIAVKVDASDTVGSGGIIKVALSWNNGVSSTTLKQTSALGTSDVVYILGGPSDTWGRTWSPAEFSNANFEVIIESLINGGSTNQVDGIEVRVYHQAGGGGGGGGGSI